MREIEKYNILKEKLQGICDKNSLTYSIQERAFPFLLIVKPLTGVDSQQTMLEGMDAAGETGYINPDASLVFAYRDGALNYKISETFTISDALFTKIKNLFKNLHAYWMMYFFRDFMECGGAGFVEASNADQEPKADPVDEDTADAFADFMAETEPAVDDEEIEE